MNIWFIFFCWIWINSMKCLSNTLYSFSYFSLSFFYLFSETQFLIVTFWSVGPRSWRATGNFILNFFHCVLHVIVFKLEVSCMNYLRLDVMEEILVWWLIEVECVVLFFFVVKASFGKVWLKVHSAEIILLFHQILLAYWLKWRIGRCK